MSLRKKRGYRQVVESDLDTLPLMGLFVVLIPMLLLSAVFLEISVIDLYLPGDDEAQSEDKDRFNITVRIGEDQYVVEAKGYPQEVISRTDGESVTNLLTRLADISARHPDHHTVTIVSRPTTRYEDIITVMDISRDAGLPHASLVGAES